LCLAVTRKEKERDSGAPKEKEKKERVIHTRVPAVLEEELKRFAENLRVPVSNLIRTVLEDAVTMADRASKRLSDKLAPHPLSMVLGFQPIKMNLDAPCAECAAPLHRGDDAFLGLTNLPGRHLFVCADCVPHVNKEKRNERE
jgi:hypothetical protein